MRSKDVRNPATAGVAFDGPEFSKSEKYPWQTKIASFFEPRKKPSMKEASIVR